MTEPSEAVRKGQRVWVKVIGMAASKLSMSMRDVDQQSGHDNRPMTAESQEPTKKVRDGTLSVEKKGIILEQESPPFLEVLLSFNTRHARARDRPPPTCRRARPRCALHWQCGKPSAFSQSGVAGL